MEQHWRYFCATDVRTQGTLKDSLAVLFEATSHLQQVLLETLEAAYEVSAHYANEPVFLQADQEPGTRITDLQIFGVEYRWLSNIE